MINLYFLPLITSITDTHTIHAMLGMMVMMVMTMMMMMMMMWRKKYFLLPSFHINDDIPMTRMG